MRKQSLNFRLLGFRTLLTINSVSVLEPKIMGTGMGLSTAVVFVGLIFWGFLLGPVGMFLSVPITMTLKFILDYNPRTKWIAILLGTKGDVLRELGEEEGD